MCGAEPAFPSFCHLLRSRHTSVTVWPCPIPAPSRDVAPAATTAPRGAISKRHPEIPDLWVALNDDFRAAASHIRRGPGKADRLSSRIWTQAQRKQIGETEGSLDV
jgi:hypothetical protein